ncbi:MAG TPA: N-acetyltransferase, partial [Microbacterium ginsengisoli]|nr:N-acetyltransferase [Microbacterium ginsengisoli]
DEAARGTTIVPLCPFVVRYLERTEVAGLVIAWPEVRS